MSSNESTENLRIMYVFPGQGSQYKGMGSDLYRDYPLARNIYESASEILGYDITKISFENPDEQLDLTRYTQPALLTHQVACFEVFKDLVGNYYPIPFAAAGHSLGEYTALIVAEALTFEDALKLVQKRGELMSEHGEGEMLALPLELDSAQRLAEKHYCGIASCNLPGQTVVGGSREDTDALVQEATELYPRQRAVKLKTEGAFHTYFMVTAARHFRSVLEATDITKPKIQVLSNYTGRYHEIDATTIRSRLFFQLFNTVYWTSCLQTAVNDGINTFVEFGGGIGRSPGPESKRPNLETIIKKTLRLSNHSAQYLPAINCQTITEASAFFQQL